MICRHVHRRALTLFALGAAMASCAREDNTTGPVGPQAQAPPAYAPAPQAPPPDPVLAEAQAEIGPLDPNDLGQRVLLTGVQITFIEKRVMKGGCWDFVNVVYSEAGVPQKQRRVVFNGNKKKGPFAKPELLRPGDWIMHVNQEAANIEHSSIFVRWLDISTRTALALDYPGMNRPTPGRLSRHNYSRVYTVLRPKEVKQAPAR